MRKGTLLAIVLMVSASGVLADDLLPPSWRPEIPANFDGKTLQIWEFDTPGSPGVPIAPEVDFNEYGDPTAMVMGAMPFAMYKSTDLGETGVWKTEDYIELYIPNAPEMNPEKKVRLQLTWWADGDPEIYVVPGGGMVTDEVPVTTGTLLPTGYYHSVIDYTIEPNPPFEFIYIMPRNCTLYVSEIVVDTWCVPEPASMALMGIGGLAAVMRRRRK